MRNLKTIRKEASGVARAATGPLGARPLQRVISDHLGFFEGLRAEGASWEQIAALMASEGLRARTGGVISAGVLRALCSRAAAEASSGARRIATAPPTSSNDTAEKRVAPLVAPVAPNTAGGSLAQTIARAARLRGISSNTGIENDET
jgi:hypothetical protein